MKKSVIPGWRKTILETLLFGGLVIALALLIHPLAAIDHSIITEINDLPSSLLPLMQSITWLGNVPTLIGVAVIWSGVELARKRRDRAVAMLASLVSLPLFLIIKETVRRSRPVLSLVSKVGFHGYSFPSGHATGSAAVYGVLSFMVARELPSPWNRVASSIAIIVVILIGVSRVYLGAHFPTDVIGGWLLGLACYNLVASQQRRRPSEVVSSSEIAE